MRFLSILGLALIHVPALASYDLLLVPDEGTNSVHRFDGTSGAYLGEFGKGRLSFPQSVAVDPSTGRAYVTSFFTNSIQVYNYSTGLFLNEFTVPGNPRSIAFSGGNLLISGDGFARRYTTSGSSLTTFATSGVHSGLAVGSDGNVYIYNLDSIALRRYTPAGILLNTAAIPANGGWARYQAMTYGDSLVFVDGTSNDIDFITANASMPITRSINVGSAIFDVTGITAGHGPSAYVCGRL